MTGSYLLHNELHYNGLMTDWGLIYSLKNEINPMAKSTKNKQRENVIDMRKEDIIRDIWQQYVLVQEERLRQRSEPIDIDIQKTEFSGNFAKMSMVKLQEPQVVKQILCDHLHLECIDWKKGELLVEDKVLASLKDDTRREIIETLAPYHVGINLTPSLKTRIDFSEGMQNVDKQFATLNEIRTIDAELQSETSIVRGRVNDIATFIGQINFDTKAILQEYLGSSLQLDKRYSVVYENKYIPLETLQQYYQEIGLYCYRYTLIFKVDSPYAIKKLRSYFDWDVFSEDTTTLTFKRNFNKDSSFDQHTLQEINDNISTFYEICHNWCSRDEIKVDCQFAYGCSDKKAVATKSSAIAHLLSSLPGVSYNPWKQTIGIDFNWRTNDLDTKIAAIKKIVPEIDIPIKETHKYKYRLEQELEIVEELESKLNEHFIEIKVVADKKKNHIDLVLSNENPKTLQSLQHRLQEYLNELESSFPTLSQLKTAKITFPKKEEGYTPISIDYRPEEHRKEIEESLKELRGNDFSFSIGSVDRILGKLIRVNYPQLIFDLAEGDEIRSLLENSILEGASCRVSPMLVGESEKIARLKESYTNALAGRNLVNKRLQRFIFNSQEATKTRDLEEILNKEGYVYKDLTRNLLNPYINESQKQAILKCLFAEDLAVVQGPPGTGKSTAIAELIWQLVRKGMQQGEKRERILLTSETNLAVDNAIARVVNEHTNLVKPVRFGEDEKLESEGRQFSLSLMERWVEGGIEYLEGAQTMEDEQEGTEENATSGEPARKVILQNWLDNIARRSFNGIESSELRDIWCKCLANPSKNIREKVHENYLKACNVIGATCSSIGQMKANNAKYPTPFYRSYQSIFGVTKKNPYRKSPIPQTPIEFTTVIQDESSKSTPAELVLPFVYGKRSIVIGDHRQLPPMLNQEEIEQILVYALKRETNQTRIEKLEQLLSFIRKRFEELETSHFQRLYENADESIKATFNLQYRMHPSINEVIEQFYKADGGLRCGLVCPTDLGVDDPNINNPASRYHGINVPGLIDENTHVLFIQSNSPEMLHGTSRVNHGEVDIIDRFLTRLEQSPSFKDYQQRFEKEEDRQIGIISFYGKQLGLIREMTNNHRELPIRVSTVDRFQGMERSIIIVSMVRSHVIKTSQDQMPNYERYPEYGYAQQKSLGFAQSPNRLNVALSRAKRLLVIIGNETLFSSKPIYQSLFDTIRANTTNHIISGEEV